MINSEGACSCACGQDAPRDSFIEKTIANLKPAPGAPDMCEMMTMHLDQLETFDLSHPTFVGAALQMLYSQAHQGCIGL